MKRLEIVDESGDLLKLKCKKDKALTAVRMSRMRASRKSVVNAIESSNVRRLAARLDFVRGGHKYIVVQDAISKTTTLASIITKGKVEPITFSCTPPYLRTMRNVTNSVDIMPDLLAAIKIIFPDCSTIKVKLLHSKAGDTAQLTHTDYVPSDREPSSLVLKKFHYSAVISIEENTELLVGEAREVVKIPLHSMLFFRGDMLHAGAGYEAENSRIFISVASSFFPATQDVSLHL